jgi:hypothetical protein
VVQSKAAGRAGHLPNMRLHQARHVIRTQRLLHVVGSPELHGHDVGAHVEAVGGHQDRQVPVDLDGPLDQEAALGQL